MKVRLVKYLTSCPLSPNHAKEFFTMLLDEYQALSKAFDILRPFFSKLVRSSSNDNWNCAIHLIFLFCHWFCAWKGSIQGHISLALCAIIFVFTIHSPLVINSLEFIGVFQGVFFFLHSVSLKTLSIFQTTRVRCKYSSYKVTLIQMFVFFAYNSYQVIFGIFYCILICSLYIP